MTPMTMTYILSSLTKNQNNNNNQNQNSNLALYCSLCDSTSRMSTERKV